MSNTIFKNRTVANLREIGISWVAAPEAIAGLLQMAQRNYFLSHQFHR
ncbi:hypothetical protein TUMEXPCC7403_02385 [Tumidithrix helvetica PCC 7403]